MRPFECWVTRYYQIVLSLSKFGFNEYSKRHCFGLLTLASLKAQAFLAQFLGRLNTYKK